MGVKHGYTGINLRQEKSRKVGNLLPMLIMLFFSLIGFIAARGCAWGG